MRPVLWTPIIGPRSQGGSLRNAERRFSDEDRHFCSAGIVVGPELASNKCDEFALSVITLIAGTGHEISVAEEM